MYRKQLDYLKKWHRDTRPKPLMLRGARQTGKSTLVHLFTEEQKIDLVEINFENTKLRTLEDENNFDLQKTLYEIESVTNKKIKENSLIFFDEIQAQPKAVEKLRYFYESKKNIYRIICAGSLLEIALEQSKISMPVGRVEYLFMGPMTFEEFLIAKNETILLDQIQNIEGKSSAPLVEKTHHRLIECFKKYLFVGGMPEAVDVFIKTNNFDEVRRVQWSILNTYRDDLPKYVKKTRMAHYMLDVFNYTLLHAGENKVAFSDIAETNSTVVKTAIDLLSKTHVIHRCYHTNASGLPLVSQKKEKIMKLFFLDVGLLNCAQGVKPQELFLFDGESLLTKGLMAEQFAAQHLACLSGPFVPPELFYWINDEKVGKAEVDFVISKNGHIYPCEIKSGASGKFKSLWQFAAQKKSKYAIKLNLNLAEFTEPVKTVVSTKEGRKKIEVEVIQCPLYLIFILDRFLL